MNYDQLFFQFGMGQSKELQILCGIMVSLLLFSRSKLTGFFGNPLRLHFYQNTSYLFLTSFSFLITPTLFVP
jgi:hypothetical protein